MKEQTRTWRLLLVIQVLAWVMIIGFMIEAGSILISYFVSCKNPEAAKNLYNGLNFYNLRQTDFWIYSRTVYLMVAALMMKSSVCYLIHQTIAKINVQNPSRYEI